MNTLIQEVIAQIKAIPDPEIPVITIEELGMLRNITFEEGRLNVIITPTYTGCPAMNNIEKDIISIAKEKDINCSVKTILSPAWTTDWIGNEAREKLRKYGIAPPEKATSNKAELLGKDPEVRCPQCNSTNTVMVNYFGSTACKALYKCNNCLEPFDYFKCH